MPAPNAVRALRNFTENGAGVYRASVRVPANCILRGVRYYNRVQPTAASSAALVIGTAASGNELLTSTNLKSAVSIHEVADADLDTNQPTPTAGLTVYATITTVGAGTAGRGTLEVDYERIPDGVIAFVAD